MPGVDLPWKRTMAHLYVEKVNSETVCARCGGQPIEWHREEHTQAKQNRVGELVWLGSSIARIKREMDLCTPLCRSCHMQEDGRMDNLVKMQKERSDMVKKLGKIKDRRCRFCNKECGPQETTQGLCKSCYDHERTSWPFSRIVCLWGHYKIGDNVYISNGKRLCKRCTRDTWSRKQKRKGERRT